MSIHDAEYARQFEQHLADCARDLVLGAKVYRARYGRIEEGVVDHVGRCRIDSGGNVRPDDAGAHAYYGAKGVGPWPQEWDGQTYQWRWFFRLADARKELVREAKRRIEDMRVDIAKQEALIAANTDPPEGDPQ